NNLAITFPLTFTNAFSAAKNLYGLASDLGGLNSGWKTLGTFTVEDIPVGPGLRSLTPTIGAGASGNFTGVFTHSGGANSHYLGYILLLPTPNVVQFTAAGSCMV